MSRQIKRELEVLEVTSYPKAPVGPRRFLIIEYKITKEEINRYEVVLKDE